MRRGAYAVGTCRTACARPCQLAANQPLIAALYATVPEVLVIPSFFSILIAMNLRKSPGFHHNTGTQRHAPGLLISLPASALPVHRTDGVTPSQSLFTRTHWQYRYMDSLAGGDNVRLISYFTCNEGYARARRSALPAGVRDCPDKFQR